MFNGKLVILRPKLPSDAANDYRWQTNTEFCRLNNKPPLKISFYRYLDEYNKILDNPPQDKHEFAIDTLKGQFIGNCAYYDINNTSKKAEVGITIGEQDFWGKSYGYDALNLLVGYIFSNTDLKLVYLKTLVDNKRAQNCFAKCGFSYRGSFIKNGDSFILMELDKTVWCRQLSSSNRVSEATKQ